MASPARSRAELRHRAHNTKHGGPINHWAAVSLKEIVMKIENPVLPGFNADPSMIRVGDTYYLSLIHISEPTRPY